MKSACYVASSILPVERREMGTTGKADFKIEPLVLDSGCVLSLGDQQPELCAGKITVTASMCSSPAALGAPLLHGGSKLHNDLSYFYSCKL